MPIYGGESIQDLIRRVARELGVDPQLALAIAQQESGFNPDIIGDNGHSVGLFQLNDRGEGYGMSVAERKDPERNARIALTQVANVAREHPDWSPGAIAAAAQRPADRNGYAVSVNNLYGHAGGTSTATGGGSGATANTPGPTGQAAPAQSYNMPAGGTLTTINGGYAMVVYLVAPGVALAFAVTDGVNTTGMPTQDLTSEQWDQYRGGVVLGGDAKTLGGAAKDFPDFQTYWNSMLDMFLGPDAAARADKDVLMVLAKKVERPSMSDEELQNLLKGTQYWKDRTEGQLSWNDKSPAEQAKLVADQMAALTNEYIRLVGVQPSENSLKAMNVWAVKVASGEVGFNQAVNVFVKGDALVDPESPWSRQLRDTEEAGKQRGVDVTNQTETARTLAAKWGV